MKKLLIILSALTITATSGSTIVACEKIRRKSVGQLNLPEPNLPEPNLPEPNLPEPNLPDFQKVERVQNELQALNMTIWIGEDEKNNDKIIEKIKNSTEVKAITDKYKATLVRNRVTNEWWRDKNTFVNGDVVDFHGIVRIGEPDYIWRDFIIKRITIKIIGEDEANKQQANDAVAALSKLTGLITIRPSDLIVRETNKKDVLNNKLLEHKEVKNIIKNIVRIEGYKFTLTVNGVDADDNNLKDKTEVEVSGWINVNKTISDNKFSFTIKLAEKTDKEIANDAVHALKELSLYENKIEINLLTLGKDKISDLNEKLLESNKIKAIIKDTIELEDKKFIFKVGNAKATNDNLLENTNVTVLGKIKVNGVISDEFIFNITIINFNRRDANKKVAELSNLRSFVVSMSSLIGNDKKTVLNNEIDSILYSKIGININSTELEGGKFILKVNGKDADNENLKLGALVEVTGRIIIDKTISDKKFKFTVTLVA